MIEKRDAEVIAQATHAYRPDWPIASMVTMLADERIRYRPYRDIAHALTVVALDPASRTPARVITDGPWWQAVAALRGRDQTPSHVSPRNNETCARDGHSGWAGNCPQCASERKAVRP